VTFPIRERFHRTANISSRQICIGEMHPHRTYLNPPPLTAVRFDRENGRHAVTGTAAASVSPEGIAFSPNSRFIVTAALTRSFMPWSDERLTTGGALDLISLDARTGRLSHLANYPLQGILTEGLAFDASGNFVAVTHFDRYERAADAA
jgi:hypothetical protein